MLSFLFVMNRDNLFACLLFIMKMFSFIRAVAYLFIIHVINQSGKLFMEWVTEFPDFIL